MDDLLIRDFSKLGNSARDNFASAMGSTKLAEAIATDSRLGSRAMERVYLANSVNVRHGAGSPLERRVAAAYVAEPDRIERLCGLALHSHFLRTIVEGAAFQKLSGRFDLKELAIACSLADVVPAQIGNQIDMERLGELVAMAGRNCVIGWFLTLPDGLASEIEVSMVGDRLARVEGGMQVQPAVARRIVEAVVSR
ncbi:MAG: hypothetical protein KDJ48_00365 [Nitratireductor sp.]|nr:hypothetical protein [Nitratireductor sp.]